MQSKNVVTIGGGTGSFMLLSGLKKYPLNIAAIVSVADDGGSTGRLRDELGVLPPGDVRQCLVALSDSSDTLRQLMNYRFEGGGLKGHNFGNLLISALEKIKGSFSDGVMEAAKILNVKGEVIPVTNSSMRLSIILNNGRKLRGEKYLDYNPLIHRYGIREVKLEKPVKACQAALKRITQADVVIIGPGDHYASVLPNLMVKEISLAIRRSPAKVVYNCNLTNKKGQTEGFDLDAYVAAIEKYIGHGRVDFVTYNKTMPNKSLVKKYEILEGEGMFVRLQEAEKKRHFRVVKADLVKREKVTISQSELLSRKHSFIRHDSEKMGQVLYLLAMMGDINNLVKEIV